MGPSRSEFGRESERIISPFEESEVTVAKAKRGSGLLLIISIGIFLVVGGGVAGVIAMRYVNNPYRTLENFPVSKYFDGYQGLAGSKFKVEFRVEADLGWKDGVGHLMLFSTTDDAKPIAVLIPAGVANGIYFTKGRLTSQKLKLKKGDWSMQIRARRIKVSNAVGLLCIIGAFHAGAQQPLPASSGLVAAEQPTSTVPPSTPSGSSLPEAPQTPTLTPAVPSNGDSSSSSTSSTLDYPFNHKPQDGSAAKEGMAANQEAKTDAMAQDAMGGRQIEDPEERARFERYLAMNEVPQEQLGANSNDMSSVIDLLHQKKTTEAWQQLYKFAKYQEIDAGVSWELANRIESIWNADETKYQIAQQNDALRKEADSANRNADLDSDEIKDQEIDYARKLKNATGSTPKPQNNGGAPQANQQVGETGVMTAPPSDQILGKLQLTAEYLDSLQAQAKIKLNDLKVEKLFDQAKQDFADYITALYNSGRYQHVLIAADFWRQIFDEGDYPVSMAKQVNASLEANNEIISAIGVFNNNLDQKNIAAATDNLEQAFMLNEINPALLGVPLAKKRLVQTFTGRLWLSVAQNGHSIASPAENFVRDYFAALLDSEGPTNRGQWVDIDLKTKAEPALIADQPTLTGWLPQTSLLSDWQAIHRP